MLLAVSHKSRIAISLQLKAHSLVVKNSKRELFFLTIFSLLAVIDRRSHLPNLSVKNFKIRLMRCPLLKDDLLSRLNYLK